MRIVNLDESHEARVNLSLAVLEAASKGAGPKAEVAADAFRRYTAIIAEGGTQSEALDEARAVLVGGLHVQG